MNNDLYRIAREINESIAGPSRHWVKGTKVTHPDGYEVEIISGQYFGSYGGVSNHWTWKRLDTGAKENGYGW